MESILVPFTSFYPKSEKANLTQKPKASKKTTTLIWPHFHLPSACKKLLIKNTFVT